MANPMTSLAPLFVVSIIFLPILPSFHNVEATGQREFDYFLLTLLWPGTICAATHHCCSSNACCRSSALTEFTIHGLWVDYNDGTWPACCSHSDFDIKKIKSLLPTLEKYWPSLYCSSSSLCFGGKGLFWAHEVAISGTSCCFMLIFLCITNLLYFSCMCLMVFGSVQWEKHGTCAYPVIKDEYSYFSKALDLYFKYNMTEVLNVAGILATNSEKYPLHDVVTIIQTAFGATPSLVCKHDSVEELRLCFDKDFKPRDCTKSSCPKYIRLPTYAPLGLEDVSGAYPHDSF